MASAKDERKTTNMDVFRLRGGGGDGGSTGSECRDALLRMRAGEKPESYDRKSLERARWTRCCLDGDRLRVPIVCDGLGRLYNKTSLLEALLKKSVPDGMKHVRSIKDVLELRMTEKDRKVCETSDVDTETNGSDYLCPVTGLDFNGNFKFFALRPSGIVVSEKAIKEFPQAVEEICGDSLDHFELIPINPSAEETVEIRLKLLEKQAMEDAKKLRKKKRKMSERSNTKVETPAK